MGIMMGIMIGNNIDFFMGIFFYQKKKIIGILTGWEF